jgi:hypothetical protein
MPVAFAHVVVAPVFLINRLDLDEDIDEDSDDDSDDDFERDDDDDDESDADEDEEEPETWQVACAENASEYSERSTCGCESPKGRLNLTFQPLTA